MGRPVTPTTQACAHHQLLPPPPCCDTLGSCKYGQDGGAGLGSGSTCNGCGCGSMCEYIHCLHLYPSLSFFFFPTGVIIGFIRTLFATRATRSVTLLCPMRRPCCVRRERQRLSPPRSAAPTLQRNHAPGTVTHFKGGLAPVTTLGNFAGCPKKTGSAPPASGPGLLQAMLSAPRWPSDPE